MHSSMFSQSLNFFLFSLKHLLNQKHLTLFLNKLPTIFSVLWSFDRNGKACCFSHIDFTLNLWINGQLSRLDISFTYFTQTTFSCWSILLPYSELFIFLALNHFTIFFCLLKGKDKFVWWKFEWILFLLLTIDRSCIAGTTNINSSNTSLTIWIIHAHLSIFIIWLFVLIIIFNHQKD